MKPHYLRLSVVYFLALLLEYLSCSEYFIRLARPFKLIFQFLYKMFADCIVKYNPLLATNSNSYSPLRFRVLRLKHNFSLSFPYISVMLVWRIWWLIQKMSPGPECLITLFLIILQPIILVSTWLIVTWLQWDVTTP